MTEEKRTKRKRVSKNKKKNWRKHCDISDVEKHLDIQRQDERIGEPSKLADSELFYLSVKPHEEAPVKKKEKQLRCLSNLRSRSAVKDPIKKRNRVRAPSEKTSEWVKRLKREAELTKPSRILASKQRNASDVAFKRRKREKQLVAKGKASTFDLWGDKQEEEPMIEKELVDFYLEETRQLPARRLRHMDKKPSKLPAVEVPHPGASYNPTYEDHQELLRKANEVELGKVKKENAIHRNTTKMFPTREEAPTHETWLKEMSGGLFDESDDESEEEGEEGNTVKNPTITDENRKTKQKRKREKRAKVKAIKSARLKDMYQRESQVFRVKSLYKEIAEEQKQQADKAMSKRAAKQEKEDFHPKKLSRLNYEPQDLEVNLSSEIAGNLRLVKTEGDLLEDRYKSLIRRNIVETRKKHNLKRKYKRKKYRRANDLTDADTKGVTVKTKMGDLTVVLQK